MRSLAALLVLLCPSLLFAQSAFSPVTVLDDVSITSDSSVSSQHLQQIKDEVLARHYRGDAPEEVAQRANYELRKDGYFKADTTAAHLKLMSETPLERHIAVTLSINEGQQYRLQQIVFEDNKAYTSSLLRQEFEIADGDVFDVEKIRRGIEKLRELYASKGQIDFTPVPAEIVNDQSRTIVLKMVLDEGPQWKVGSLLLDDRWPKSYADRLRSIVQPNSGRAYFPQMVQELQAALAEMFPGSPPIKELIAFTRHTDTHTLDIELQIPMNGDVPLQ